MDNPLNLDSSWCCLNVQGRDPRAMIQQGPNIRVTIAAIAAIAADGTRLAVHVCGAIIDTGAEASCVSPDMFAKLAGGVQSVRDIAHAYGNVTGERTVRACVSWMPEVAFERNFSLLDHLAPYHVLIGRDILCECRF
ncbi:MAG: hypothetical protein KUA43_04845 [Hoeflea sp.]|uniref:hypothetical protein n=1 Tax=Hoeflea sp. TaxID=1940281 RepID=UPI001DA6950F|nr:hypothetical protein [Hoeflea sp.]MBU4527457.1 hypothetical protein [Alphaproteobacteria bacterium]MBU4543901.1 hypothetical protein [Alphaproteobacteria bacterium]MBU4548843.1 hypothetical protein [Alphaproteobacteria bacterium]MBV1722749.1 hypothetical protein [Hoeflea sp.]MBV1785398.1 hypothetical protein [Hoeflea sp.]